MFVHGQDRSSPDPVPADGNTVVPKRFIARVLVVIGASIPVTVAVALASTGDREPAAAGPVAEAEPIDGAFSASPHSGEAVFRAQDLAPGQTIDGTVLVTNEGSGRGMFWLARTGFSDRQGPGGGTLSERLQVTVLDVTVPGEPTLVYTGGLGDMGARPLGFIAPGRSRIYSAAATLLPGPGAGEAGNPYEGSVTSVSMRWGAIAGEPPAPSATPRLRPRPRDRRAPRLRLDIPPRQRLLETGSLVVNVRCDEACRLAASGRLSAEGAPRSAARASRRAEGGRATPLRITFGSAARRAMRDALIAGRSVPVAFTVVGRDQAGNRTRAGRRIWLRPGR